MIRSFLWAFNCGRSDLLEKSSSDLSSNYFVCTDHIEEKYFISRENPITVTGDIVPTIFEDTRRYLKSKFLKNYCILAQKKKKRKQINFARFSPALLGTLNAHFDENGKWVKKFLTRYISGIFFFFFFLRISKLEWRNMPKKRHARVSEALLVKVTIIFPPLIFFFFFFFCSAYEQSQGLANTCRICGDSENLTTDFDGLQEEQVQMREKINLVLPISVQHGDQLSKKLCSFCCKNIRNFYDLVEISLKNDIKWKKLLNVTKNFEVFWFLQKRNFLYSVSKNFKNT